MKAPYTLVVGDRDIEAGTYTVRDRAGHETGGIDLDELVRALVQEVRSRSIEPTPLGG
jgi:threonyl-tRNA synthetase